MKVKKGKKFLALVLTIVFICSSFTFPVTAQAATLSFGDLFSSKTEVDKTALSDAISEAASTVSSAIVSADGANVSKGVSWVTQKVMTAYTSAITAAKAVYSDSSATQIEVDSAAGILNVATTAFSSAISVGTKIGSMTIVDKTELLNALAKATLAKVDVAIATDAANVSKSVNWVTNDEMTALTNAITAAEAVYSKSDATEAEVKSAISALNTAINTFNTAFKAGAAAVVKSDLSTLISQANSILASVKISTISSTVSQGCDWVLTEEMTAYKAAIAVANQVYESNTATETDILAAIEALHKANVTFVSLIKKGTSLTNTSDSPSIGGTTTSTPPTSSTSLTDIANHWAYDAIVALEAKGIISGTTDGKFEPDLAATRAELAKMVATAFDYTTSKISSGFSDITSSDWYSTYVNALSENKIISGMTDSIFSPNTAITREQLATIVYRILEDKGVTLAPSSTTTLFADDSSISSWAKEAVYTLKANGIISGEENNLFNPQSFATKAEVASMIQRILKTTK